MTFEQIYEDEKLESKLVKGLALFYMTESTLVIKKGFILGIDQVFGPILEQEYGVKLEKIITEPNIGIVLSDENGDRACIFLTKDGDYCMNILSSRVW